MPVHPLPPQAYTKETLQKAYTWLLTQNPSVKEMASTQDMLVSLYLKAQRNGAESLDTPSIQNFKQELKSLANMMGDFQSNGQPHAHSQNQMAQPSAPSYSQPPHAPQAPQAHQPTYSPPPAAQSPEVKATMTLRGTAASLLQDLDAVTLQCLADVRTTLNLSSDAEALRALVALGHRHFKKIQS